VPDEDHPELTGGDVLLHMSVLRSAGFSTVSENALFDKAKGFGFVNMHADDADVFVHMEVLRRFGLPDLDPGEAVLVRAVEGPRGRMACEVRPWDFSFRSS